MAPQEAHPVLKLVTGKQASAKTPPVSERILASYQLAGDDQSVYEWLKTRLHEHLYRPEGSVREVLQTGDFSSIYGEEVNGSILTFGFFDPQTTVRAYMRARNMSEADAVQEVKRILAATITFCDEVMLDDLAPQTYYEWKEDPAALNARVWAFACGDSSFATHFFTRISELFEDNLPTDIRPFVSHSSGPLLFGVSFAESGAVIVARLHQEMFGRFPVNDWMEGVPEREIRPMHGHPGAIAMLMTRAMLVFTEVHVKRTRMMEDAMRLADLYKSKNPVAWEEYVNSPEFRQEDITLEVLHHLDAELLCMLCSENDLAVLTAVYEITRRYFSYELKTLERERKDLEGVTGAGGGMRRINRLLRQFAIEHFIEIDKLHEQQAV